MGNNQINWSKPSATSQQHSRALRFVEPGGHGGTGGGGHKAHQFAGGVGAGMDGSVAIDKQNNGSALLPPFIVEDLNPSITDLVRSTTSSSSARRAVRSAPPSLAQIDRLLPLADRSTPPRKELAWQTGPPSHSVADRSHSIWMLMVSLRICPNSNGQL
ncbi:hypothetical protein QYF36_003589 [Acer negundo]|nr:hypothetical protein QYF36_003589 [Acer negundo]